MREKDDSVAWRFYLRLILSNPRCHVQQRRDLLRAPQLVKTNPHCAVIQTRFARHAPAEVNGLKLKAVLRAKLLQTGKHLRLQRVALRLQVAKRRTDEDANDGPETGCGVLLGHVF